MVAFDIKKDFEEWNARTFVNYFVRCYKEFYDEKYEVVYEVDCPKMKRVMEIFRKNNRPKEVIVRFINWAFKTYRNNLSHNQPIKIGFLMYMIDDYLRMNAVEFAKKKKKNYRGQISAETLAWIKKEKAKYRKKMGWGNERKK